MCSERIPPLPASFRDALVDNFCPEKARAGVKSQDTVCIARIYLGRRRLGRPSMFFSLNNYVLLVDAMEKLGLPIYDYAKSIADALAVLHWAAEVDANDVEFVLGSRRQLLSSTASALSPSHIAALPYNSSTRALTGPEPAYKLQACDETQVWLLDFDCCDSITMDLDGVEKAAVSAYRNDPYHPKPCSPGSEDYELWKTFRDRYLETSTEIAESRGLDTMLPGKFIERLIALHDKSRSEHRHFLRGPYCEPHSDERA